MPVLDLSDPVALFDRNAALAQMGVEIVGAVHRITLLAKQTGRRLFHRHEYLAHGR